MEAIKRRGMVRTRFEDLHLEIISDILTRLPIDCILRCACVCKTWQILIKDDYFVKLQMHRTNHLPSSRIILESYPDRVANAKINCFLADVQDYCSIKASAIQRFPLADAINNDNLKIMCSLNGLICLAPEVCHPDPVVVLNPLMRGDFIVLPKSEHQVHFYQTHEITLAFDHSINKYKAVSVLSYFHTDCVFEIITIGEETSWRRVFSPDIRLQFRVPRGGVFHQDSVYWIIDRCNRYTGVSNNGNRDYILQFDVTKEVFRVISFPDNMRRPTFRHKCDAMLNLRLQIMDGGSVALTENDGWLLHIWKIVKGGDWNNPVVEYSSNRIDLPSTRNVLDDFLFLERPPGMQMKQEKGIKHKKRMETELLYYFPFSSSSKKRDWFWTLGGLQVQSYENFIAWGFKPSIVSVKKALLSAVEVGG